MRRLDWRTGALALALLGTLGTLTACQPPEEPAAESTAPAGTASVSPACRRAR